MYVITVSFAVIAVFIVRCVAGFVIVFSLVPLSLFVSVSLLMHPSIQNNNTLTLEMIYFHRGSNTHVLGKRPEELPELIVAVKIYQIPSRPRVYQEGDNDVGIGRYCCLCLLLLC